MIKVLTDTTASLDKDDYQQAGIIPIPLLIREEYATKKDIFEIGPDEFYREQRKGTSYTTTHLEPEGFLDYFRPLVENGDEVICILLSGMISPCVKAATRAVELLQTDRITIVDSRQSGFGQAYMALKAKELVDRGARREEIIPELARVRERTRTYFIVGSLDHLKKGGRFFWDQVLKMALTRVKPVIWFDDAGRMKLTSALGSLSEVKERTTGLVREHAKRGIEQLALQYADNAEEARAYAAELQSIFGVEPRLIRLSPVAGTHTGPDLLSPVLIAKE